jgi:hypothetical protein
MRLYGDSMELEIEQAELFVTGREPVVHQALRVARRHFLVREAMGLVIKKHLWSPILHVKVIVRFR